jgi:anti-sigma B factor antagonist
LVTRGESEGLRRPPVEAVERRNGSVVVRLAGELDLYNVAEVSSALADAADEGADRLVVDLAEVSFLDSTALGALVAAKRELAAGTRLVLAAPGEDVLRALEVSGLAAHFEVRGSVEDALGATG